MVIRCLLYADDLVLFALTPADMQRQINRLMAYCEANHLHTNNFETQNGVHAYHPNTKKPSRS